MYIANSPLLVNKPRYVQGDFAPLIAWSPPGLLQPSTFHFLHSVQADAVSGKEETIHRAPRNSIALMQTGRLLEGATHFCNADAHRMTAHCDFRTRLYSPDANRALVPVKYSTATMPAKPIMASLHSADAANTDVCDKSCSIKHRSGGVLFRVYTTSFLGWHMPQAHMRHDQGVAISA